MSFFSKLDIVNLPLDSNITLANQALTHFEKAENWKLIVRCYNKLSGYHFNKNNFDEAERLAKKARDLAAEKLGKENSSYIDALFNLTTFLDVRGFHEDAILQYQKIIESDKKLNTYQDDVALSYQNIAQSYIAIGDYEEAVEALNNALGIRMIPVRKSDYKALGLNQADIDLNQAEIGAIYASLADCQKLKNEFTKSIAFFTKSLNTLQQFKKDNRYVNQIRYNCFYKLADIYFKKGQKNLARKYINKAIQIKDKYYVFDDCFSYLILGKLNLDDGKKEDAFSYFDQAIKAATNEADGYANFPQIAATYAEKGKAHLSVSEFDKALFAFQKGLQTVSLDFESDDVKKNPSLDQIVQKLGALDLITGKARVFFEQYKSGDEQVEKLEQAHQQYILAIQLIKNIRQGYTTNATKYILAQKANLIYEQAIDICYLLFLKTDDKKYKEQAFTFAERNKAITLLESINEDIALSLAGLPDSLIEMERALSIKLNFEEKRLAEAKAKPQENTQANIKEIAAQRFSLKEQHKNLINHIEKNHPKYYLLKYTDVTATVQKLKHNVLDDQTAMISFFVGEQFIYSFLLTEEGLWMNKIEEKSSFERQINNLRQTITTAPESESFIEGFKTYSENAYGLYKTIFQEHLETIHHEVKNLIIIPDDIIGFIPFDLLLTKAPNPQKANYSPSNLSYLMEQFSISYNYSGTLLLNNQKVTDRKNNNNFIGFVPSFNEQKNIAERTCNDSRLYNLKCASKEVNTINEMFDGIIVEDLTATKKLFMEQVSDYDIVHLATHACVNETNAMLNRIHFSDDYVTMYDLYNLKLNANLLVLSACNTGAGKIIKGEGVISLSRGFMQSGVASVLMSLWSVDDCATSDIMTSFYQELARGQAKDAALQKAKLNYINIASDKIKAHPYYWAAFIPCGDMKPPSRFKPSKLIYWLVPTLISLIVLLFFFLKKPKNKKSSNSMS